MIISMGNSWNMGEIWMEYEVNINGYNGILIDNTNGM